jgi:hypothetical protein
MKDKSNTSGLKHTPTPWRAVKINSHSGVRSWYEIQFGNDGECVIEVVHNEADALLIVNCVNAATGLMEGGVVDRSIYNNPTGIPFCCQIGCNKDAAFELQYCDVVPENTHSCVEHLVELSNGERVIIHPIESAIAKATGTKEVSNG